MEEVGKLYVSLELEDEKFLQGLTAAENKFEKTKETVLKMEKTFQDIGVKMAAFGAVVVGAMGLAANSWAEAGDSIGKMSKRTGIGTTALQELSYAAKLSGTSIDEIEVAVRKMQSSVTDAETGLETAKKSFQDLGLSIKDIKSLSPEDQFNRISEAIAGIENPTKRAALAQDIFGRSGTMLLPMLAEGSAGLRKLRDDAHQYSVIMNTESVAAAEEFSDRMDNLKLSLKSVWQEIAVSIIPAVTKFVSIVQDTVTGVKKWGQAQPELTSFLATTTLAVGALSVAVGTLLIGTAKMVTVFGTLQAILFAQILPAMKSFMMLILSINPIILSLVVASGLIIAKLYEWDTAQQATNKSIESSLQLQTKLKNKVVEGVAIWKQYGAASKEALIQSGITAEQAKKAMEGMFSLSATLSGEDQAKWRARAELYKQVYQDLSSRANSSCAEMLALSGKELEGQRRNEAILKAEMDARRKEEIEAVKQTEAAKEQLRINYLSSIAQKIRLSLMDKQLVMQQERDFAIANAEEMGLSIDEINEYYAQKEYERRTQKLEQILAVTQQMTNQLGAVSSQYFQNKITELDNWATKEKDAVNNSQMSEEQKSAAIQRIDEKLATEKRKIAREQASMEKATSLASAIVNTAEAVVKALTAGPILGPILAGIIGSMGAAQVSLIASQPLPAFEFGGIVPGNSFVGDNMLAAVNSGEMILNRGQQATLFDIANGRGGAAGVTQSINVYLDRRAIASAVVADMPAILRLNGVCPI